MISVNDVVRFNAFPTDTILIPDSTLIGYVAVMTETITGDIMFNIVIPGIGIFSRFEHELTKATPEEEMLWRLEHC